MSGVDMATDGGALLSCRREMLLLCWKTHGEWSLTPAGGDAGDMNLSPSQAVWRSRWSADVICRRARATRMGFPLI